jgi:neopullulanase
MSTPKRVKDAVFYQIFPDRFAKSALNPAGNLPFEAWESAPTTHGFKGGDLYGVIEKLDYLKELGITAIYFNPIFSSASNHRYHTYDYYNIDPLLGGNDAFKKLIKEAHKRDIRIVLDGVFNHASRGFWQFNHVLETGSASPYRGWFHFDEERLNGTRRWGAFPTQNEESALRHEDSLTAIGNPVVREYIFDIAEYWVKMGIDGWRLDVPGEIDDDEFWREFRRRVRAVNPDTYIVGEVWHEAQRWLQGDQFDAVMNYLFTAISINFFGAHSINHHVIHAAGGLKDRIHPMSAYDCANELDRILNLYPEENTYAQLNLLDSHDMPRFLSCVSGDKSALKLAWLLMFTVPGAPCIYYGDEVGVDGGHDPDCRKAFPWDESKQDRELLEYVKTCTSLRAEHAALRRGDFKRVHAEGELMAYSRTYKNETIFIAFNASNEEKTLELPLGKKPQALFGKPIISGSNATVPPRSGVVIK